MAQLKALEFKTGRWHYSSQFICFIKQLLSLGTMETLQTSCQGMRHATQHRKLLWPTSKLLVRWNGYKRRIFLFVTETRHPLKWPIFHHWCTSEVLANYRHFKQDQGSLTSNSWVYSRWNRSHIHESVFWIYDIWKNDQWKNIEKYLWLFWLQGFQRILCSQSTKANSRFSKQEWEVGAIWHSHLFGVVVPNFLRSPLLCHPIHVFWLLHRPKHLDLE